MNTKVEISIECEIECSSDKSSIQLLYDKDFEDYVSIYIPAYDSDLKVKINDLSDALHIISKNRAHLSQSKIDKILSGELLIRSK